MPVFQQLWINHPNNKGDEFPCRDPKTSKPAFENQCAIRVGISLHRAGVDLSSFTGARCWHGHEPGHILRAQELADWLRGQTAFGRFLRFAGTDSYTKAHQHMASKKGIVFYKNFWGQGGQGDHIDLWNKRYSTRELSTFFAHLFGGANYKKAQEVWFWEMA